MVSTVSPRFWRMVFRLTLLESRRSVNSRNASSVGSLAATPSSPAAARLLGASVIEVTFRLRGDAGGRDPSSRSIPTRSRRLNPPHPAKHWKRPVPKLMLADGDVDVPGSSHIGQ